MPRFSRVAAYDWVYDSVAAERDQLEFMVFPRNGNFQPIGFDLKPYWNRKMIYRIDQALVLSWVGMSVAICCGTSSVDAIVTPGGHAFVAHDLPDGFVERSTAILIRDRQIKIEYAVGLSAGTMRSLLERWGEQIDGGWRAPAIDDEMVREEFVKRSPQHLLKGVNLRLDDRPLEMEVRRAERSVRHHYDLELTLQADLPKQPGMWRMEWDDKNFLDLDGAIRKSCKAAGRSLLIRSNAAPIIVRAERVELGKLSKEDRHEASRILATVKWLGPRDEGDQPTPDDVVPRQFP